MSWKKVEIKEFGRVVTGKTPPTKEMKYFNGNYNFISPKDLEYDSRYIFNSQTKISSLAIEKFKNQVLPKNSVFFTALSYGFGKIGIASTKCLTNQQINSIIVNPIKYDFNFIYYLLRNYTPLIRSYDAGIVTPIVPKSVFENIKLNVPESKDTQKRIADILSAYDDLIENNLKRIKLLEQAAQNIYKEWFVHLRFPGHENTPINEETGLPQGWERKSLGNLINHEIGGGWGKDTEQGDFDQPAYVIRGTDFPGIEKGDIIEIPFRFHKDSNLKTRKLNSGDIIFEVSGGSTNVGVARSLLITDKLLGRLGNDAMCASFCKLMRPINVQYSNLLILALKYLRENKTTEVYEKRSASNIVNYNWKAFLTDVEIPVPNSNLLNKYSLIIGSNIEMQDVLKSQNQKLKAARDILLPRLMNRTIDV